MDPLFVIFGITFLLNISHKSRVQDNKHEKVLKDVLS